MSSIRIAESDAQILACFPVMQTLRPHLEPTTFVERVRRQEAAGYRLAYLVSGGEPLAVAGFRIDECLSWGRHLYVDDLVTLEQYRSQGHGSALLAWLVAHAAAQGCAELHLDSGLQRKDAHRFYLREGLETIAMHFRVRVPSEP